MDALRLFGQEIVHAFGRDLPDWVAIPTSSGPLVQGVYQGFGDHGARVRILAAQAEGCAPIASAFASNATAVQPWNDPRTVASGISDPLIDHADEGTHTLTLVRKSNGQALATPDEEILSAIVDLARRTGIFCEPTAAASLSSVRRLFRAGGLDASATVVCAVTGHGFKDFPAWSSTTLDH